MFTILLIMFWFVIASTWRMVQEAMYMLVSLDLNKGLVDGFGLAAVEQYANN